MKNLILVLFVIGGFFACKKTTDDFPKASKNISTDEAVIQNQDSQYASKKANDKKPKYEYLAGVTAYTDANPTLGGLPTCAVFSPFNGKTDINGNVSLWDCDQFYRISLRTEDYNIINLTAPYPYPGPDGAIPPVPEDFECEIVPGFTSLLVEEGYEFCTRKVATATVSVPYMGEDTIDPLHLAGEYVIAPTSLPYYISDKNFIAEDQGFNNQETLKSNYILRKIDSDDNVILSISLVEEIPN